MAQRVVYEQLPGTRFDQYLFKLRLVLGYLNQPGGTKFKAFRDFMRKQNLWDKDKSEVLFSTIELTWDKSTVKIGKTAKKLLAAHSDNDFQNILFERLKELNILLVKYVLEALDVTQGGRLHSVHELYRMITSYVYPGAYITLTAFQAWIEWLAASGYIKLVGIRWALSEKGQKIVSELRSMDVDEIMEDMEDEAEAAGGDDDEDEDDSDDEDDDTPPAPAARTPAPTPVAPSMPSSPGEELTSSTSGPRLLRSRSTPATARPITAAARSAVSVSAGVRRTISALPPRCRLERNSPASAWRFIAATTFPPTTKQRMSAPRASATNSWTRKLAYRPRNASITLREAEGFSASTTPVPWVPSTSLITCGGLPSRFMRSPVSSGLSPNTVLGRPMPCSASSCMQRSLSRARRIESERFNTKVPIISNWRATAVP